MPCTYKKITLSGKGKLTAKIINKLTLFYSLVIRRNHNSAEKIKTPSRQLITTIAEQTRIRSARIARAAKTHGSSGRKLQLQMPCQSLKHSCTALHIDIFKVIKPIHEDLSKDTLLQWCLGEFLRTTMRVSISLFKIFSKIDEWYLNHCGNSRSCSSRYMQ